MKSEFALASNLPPDVGQRFFEASSNRLLTKGEHLFAIGSEPRAMFMVLRGRLQVSIYSDGGRQFFASFLSPGHWFGEIPLLDESARAFYAEAVEETEVAVLSADDFWLIAKSDSTVLLAVTRLICSRFRHAISWIEDASLHPLKVRLASRLLAIAHMEGRDAGVLHISQDMLAAQLGVARQSVNRLLQEWSRSGIVRLSYGAVEVLENMKLETIAKGSGPI